MNRTLIIPFFIPHAGCPFTCVFCNQWQISGASQTVKPQEIYPRIQSYLKAFKKKPDQVEAAFFGGSFTGLSRSVQTVYLNEAKKAKEEGLLTGIRLSTRPDYINPDIVEFLKNQGVTTIELGVQSLVDEVLQKTCRGYDYQDVLQATKAIRQYPLQMIFQLMLGLPGDNRESALLTAHRTINLKPDGIRIYPTLVLKNTELARLYQEGLYQPLKLEEAVTLASMWYAIFSSHEIPVIRMGLQATENLSLERDLLAGPYHPAFGELVESALFLNQLKAGISDLKVEPQELAIHFNPRDYSKVLGQKRAHQQALKKVLPQTLCKWVPDQLVERNDLVLNTRSQFLEVKRQDFLEIYRIKERDL